MKATKILKEMFRPEPRGSRWRIVCIGTASLNYWGLVKLRTTRNVHDFFSHRRGLTKHEEIRQIPSRSVKLADAASNLMYSIAGWLLIGLGIVSTLGAVSGVIRASSAAELLAPVLLLGFAIAFLSSGVFVNPSFRQRLHRRHNISQVGRIRCVDNWTFDRAEGIDETCVTCDSHVTEGLVRRYREEYAVAGIPIWTLSENHNYYCTTCALAELSGPSQTVPDECIANRELETKAE